MPEQGNFDAEILTGDDAAGAGAPAQAPTDGDKGDFYGAPGAPEIAPREADYEEVLLEAEVHKPEAPADENYQALYERALNGGQRWEAHSRDQMRQNEELRAQLATGGRQQAQAQTQAPAEPDGREYGWVDENNTFHPAPKAPPQDPRLDAVLAELQAMKSGMAARDQTSARENLENRVEAARDASMKAKPWINVSAGDVFMRVAHQQGMTPERAVQEIVREEAARLAGLKIRIARPRGEEPGVVIRGQHAPLVELREPESMEDIRGQLHEYTRKVLRR